MRSPYLYLIPLSVLLSSGVFAFGTHMSLLHILAGLLAVGLSTAGAVYLAGLATDLRSAMFDSMDDSARFIGTRQYCELRIRAFLNRAVLCMSPSEFQDLLGAERMGPHILPALAIFVERNPEFELRAPHRRAIMSAVTQHLLRSSEIAVA